jgi:protein gp37
MALHSAIEWTEATWNPVTGCTKISDGCRHCYAERLSLRLKAMGRANYVNGFRVTTHESALSLPSKWKKRQMVFVNSMSDLFHESVPADFVLSVFEAMNEAHWHTYQILTKRAQRLLELSAQLPWSPHIWMGVTVESAEHVHRIDGLRACGAHTKFLSLEPLLGPLPTLDLTGIDWVIVGGESGPGARPMNPEWALDLRDQCLAAKVPFFFKQWGGFNKKEAGRLLGGRTWDERPALLESGGAIA